MVNYFQKKPFFDNLPVAADSVDGYSMNQALLTTSSPTFAGLTLSGSTASTLAYLNASKKFTSLANGSGYLLNDGSGGLSWAAVSLSGYLKADRSVALTGVTGPAALYLDSDEKFAALANSTGYLYNDGAGALSWAAVDLSAYWKINGTSTPNADWNLGAYDITATDLTATNFKLSGTGTLTSTAGNASFTTALTAASGNEAAFSLNYTTNKAAGDDTGLLINQTDTASPGTSYLIDAQVGGTSKFSVSSGGAINAASGFYTSSTNGVQAAYFRNQTASEINLNNLNFSAANSVGVLTGAGTWSQTSGTQAIFKIAPTYNQASGTAANTDLLINRTETAIGSGTQRLLSAQVGSVEKVGIDNRGAIVVGMTADAVLQVGMVAMSDAGTAERFDVNGAGGTLPIGIVTGSGPTAQGTAYGLAVQGICYVAPAEDVVACTMGHVCFVDSSDAGYVDDNAALQAAGLNIGRYINTEAAIAFNGADDVDPDTDQIVLDSTPSWVVGDPVIFWDSGDTAPTGMTTGAVYWIKTIATATVTLSATRGGATLDITGDGSGTTMYLMRLPKVILHWQ